MNSTLPIRRDDRGATTYELVVEVLEGARVIHTWHGERRATIGSHPSNDVVIDEPTVSRFHCEVVATGGGLRVVDLDSRNGTRIGEVQIERARVGTGTRLRLGQATVRVGLGRPSPTPADDAVTSFHSLVGASAAMRALFRQLRQAAATDATVLVEGETGTGKEGVAEALHLESARREGPFVVVDCSAIPAGLIEAHLFGHEHGAFTGATAARAGAFEEADGGTLFLDELGELSLELQPKLLRALESREVRRVGGRKAIRADVRVVAATNRDLRTEVNAGRFRADLYFRLAVVQVALPPLRERAGDLPLLVEHFLERLGARPEVRATLSEPTFLAALAEAAWPGNIRELRNHVERCVVFQEARLPAGPGPAVSLDGEVAPYDQARRLAIEAFERAYVARLLAQCDGQVARAARVAGMNRAYLYRLIERYDLRR